ncbi:metallo-beta-lactamase class B [Flavobacterium arsenatis]|uniref:beta-lactamase n=1 Tax=Flavobacterium arsenatis TaxID=1484332 RepID=A0ABU1TSF2_9FLAO|nr:subclass B1 metallo-beta-lactamase [Flavobacterium arsenatis]MDR6968806.1 metallo-beta-lactamase class B [Flavobacterium arsenatis]
MKFLVFCFTLLFLSCTASKQKKATSYTSKNVTVKEVSPHVYQHISFLQTKSFGMVGCNGMIIIDNNEAIVFDTAIDDNTSEELINIISNQLNCKIKAVVATHFHSDCLGGLEAFHKVGIPSYAKDLTIELAKEKGSAVPQNGIENDYQFTIGTQKVEARYFGEGHTKDNIIGYFPSEATMFGGCLIKEMNAGKGNLEDANVKDWPETIRKIKLAYPDVKTIIPGHGKVGDQGLLDYTITLFQE